VPIEPIRPIWPIWPIRLIGQWANVDPNSMPTKRLEIPLFYFEQIVSRLLE
jgi:hypothetical protein